jgi:Cu+-exporting ATPase
MARLVVQAQAGKAPVQRLADRISAVFVPVVIGVAVATLALWLAAGAGAGTAFTAAVAVLIIACPCAMGLATPTAMLTGTGRAAQLGIVIKGPEILESTRAVDTLVLDKTGTVTTGRMSLAEVAAAPGVDADELLRLAGAVEDASEHPIGAAIAAGPGRGSAGCRVCRGSPVPRAWGSRVWWTGTGWRPGGRAGWSHRGGGRCRTGSRRGWPRPRRPGGPW